MKASVLQETEYFGSAVYQVGDRIVLIVAGWLVPNPEETFANSGKGVGLVLMELALRGRREAGEHWEVRSSRLLAT